MLTAPQLLEEIRAEARRRRRSGEPLTDVRVHPVTFQKLIRYLDARVKPGSPGGAAPGGVGKMRVGTMWVGTMSGTVTVIGDPGAVVIDQLYYTPAPARPVAGDSPGAAAPPSTLLRDAVFAIALEEIGEATGGNFGDTARANALTDRIMAAIGAVEMPGSRVP